MDNDQFLPQVVNLLQEGHTVTLPLRGRSMRPFLEDGRDKALLKIAKGSFVLHRIIAIDGDDVTLRGDGNLNNEYCKIIDIRAKAIGFYRKGRNKLDSTDGCKWRIYSWWWTRLYSIRRYLLFAMHPHIPRRWRRQTS